MLLGRLGLFWQLWPCVEGGESEDVELSPVARLLKQLAFITV